MFHWGSLFSRKVSALDHDLLGAYGECRLLIFAQADVDIQFNGTISFLFSEINGMPFATKRNYVLSAPLKFAAESAMLMSIVYIYIYIHIHIYIYYIYIHTYIYIPIVLVRFSPRNTKKSPTECHFSSAAML